MDNNNTDRDTLPKDNLISEYSELFQAIDVATIALDSANVGIWIIEVESRKFSPSKRTKELFGYYPENEMSFEEALLQITEKHRANVNKAIEISFKKHSYLFIEFPVIGFHDNENRWLSLTGGFNSSNVGNNYFSGIVIDITEQKQNNLRRSKFIGMVSHELKTPLTALNAYIQMLNTWATKQKDSFAIGTMSKVDRQVKKMINMINNLLNLSGAEAGKIHLNKQAFKLNELIKEVIDETLFMTSSHKIHMVPCEMINVVADRDKIDQVLVNLLSNAAKYSEKGTSIQIACALKDNCVELSVIDQGLGIAQQDIDKLFLPHYRVESKETERIPGFGIGLYLCAEIVKKHKGNICVESELGKGSTFKFTLPVNLI
ncbi:sensor histidine kinase [Arcticibacter eurypsychrophilus]|uniref:sensor histidine kinase n=1 Tax=Arcticibacter eurypsychrophilus TaxID=1434752 RepID=UPI00084DC039|nr:ATP-binding protein [Arcticibacter eurypsychrophilus]